LIPDDVLPAAFAIVSSPKRYALLLGSGLSRAAGIPTGGEIAQDRIRKTAFGLGETIPADPLAWYRERHNDTEPTFSDLFNEAGTPEDREAALCEYFTVGGTVPQPTEAHRTIARLVKEGLVGLVVTTNFDDLLERALCDEGIRPIVITERSDPAKMSVIPDQCRIVKVNGDYPDTPLKMTPKDLASYTPEITDYLGRIFSEYGLIICGWSAVDDTGLVEILTRERVRRHSVYCCHLEKRAALPEIVVKTLEPVTVQISSADEFFGELYLRIDILRGYNRKELLTPSLAVRKVKEALGQPKPELVLPNLIHEETGRLLAFLTDKSRYQADIIDGREFYMAMLTELEDAAAPLATMVATVAQYDDGTFMGLITDTIERLINVPPVTPDFSEIQNRGQMTVSDYIAGLLHLRYYPAVLVIYASGIAAVHTEHFNTLEAILRRPMKARYNDVLREKVPYYEYVNVWDAIGLCQEWMIGLAHKQFGEETSYRDYPYLAVYEFMKVLIPNQYAFFESLDVFEYLFGLAYLASTEGNVDEGAFRRSKMPGPLRSRNLYLCHHATFDSTHSLPPLPAHIVNYLANNRQRVKGSVFFGGNYPAFEAASRKYAIGFGIKSPQVSESSFVFTAVSRQ
jgi:hypothetical protein